MCWSSGMASSPTRRVSCPSRLPSLVCKTPISLLGLSETNTIGYITLLLSQHGKIVSSRVLEHPPTADALFSELSQAMCRPALGAGRARRPTRVYHDNDEVVTALNPL